MSSDRFARFGFIEYNITNYIALSAMNELFAKYNPTFRFVDIDGIDDHNGLNFLFIICIYFRNNIDATVFHLINIPLLIF